MNFLEKPWEDFCVSSSSRGGDSREVFVEAAGRWAELYGAAVAAAGGGGHGANAFDSAD